MFAVIKTGGKQYRVAADDIITVAKLAGEPGEAVTFDQVLMFTSDNGTQLGAPTVAGVDGVGRGRRADPRREGHRLQEAPPPEFAPQARPPPGLHGGADHRDPDRRREARLDGCGERPRQRRSTPAETRADPSGRDRAGGRPRRTEQESHGSQESRRLVAQRARFGMAVVSASRSSAIRSARRQHPRASARHQVARRRQRRHGQGPYPLCHRRRPRPIPHAKRPSFRIGRPPPAKRPQSKRREQDEGAPAGIHRTGGSSSRLQGAKLRIRTQGRWVPPPLRRFGLRGPAGSEQDDVSRPHPRRRSPARDPAALAALAAPRRCPAIVAARRRESGGRDDGAHPAPLFAAGRRAIRLACPAGQCGRTRAAARDRAEGRPDALIGCVGIGPARTTARRSLGYWLGAPSWGKGFATEAARALIDAFFAYTGERGAHRRGARRSIPPRGACSRSAASPSGPAHASAARRLCRRATGAPEARPAACLQRWRSPRLAQAAADGLGAPGTAGHGACACEIGLPDAA